MFKRSIFTFALSFTFLCVNVHADVLENSNFTSQTSKEKKIYSMGKKVFEKNCQQDIDLDKYATIQELEMALKDKCEPLKEKYFEALSLYLWEVKRIPKEESAREHIHITKDEKCPVCGMFVYKYPKWATQIYYMQGKEEKHYSFDGMKDLLKFYFNPENWAADSVQSKNDITKILVTDYYSQKAIDAKKAYYVIGSDAYGPMGNELIPFENEVDAKTFSKDHKGKKIAKFENIMPEEVYKLDE